MFSSIREYIINYKNLINKDQNIRNRILVVIILLVLLVVLFMFSMNQSFSVLDQSRYQLMVFVAININIVLLAIVFYMIARNLLKLSNERRKQVLGVSLKKKLITSFIVLSLPAMGFHLFASFFIASNLESWLKGQQESMVNSAQKITESYHNNLRKKMKLQSLIWETILKNGTYESAGKNILENFESKITNLHRDPAILCTKNREFERKPKKINEHPRKQRGKTPKYREQRQNIEKSVKISRKTLKYR